MTTTNFQRTTLLILLGLSAAVCGCEATQNAANHAANFAEKAADNTGKFVEKTGAKIEQGTVDSGITLAVKSALINEPTVSATKIIVTTTGGVVTLKGTQPNDAARAKAEEIARRQRDVQNVVNTLEIAP